MQLVSGLRTGSAVVGVSLSEPMYNTIKASQVRLLVMANAQLSPALAYLMPGAEIRLLVRVVQQGSDQGKYYEHRCTSLIFKYFSSAFV